LRPLFVSEVNNYIKKLFASDILLTYVQIEGEISNFTHHYSGHMYFSLKDDKSRIKCVMFKGDNEEIDFKPKDGTKVVVSGSVGVYEKDGSYQVYVRRMEKQGLGGLYRAFEELKNKLSEEGLFDPEYKIQLPSLPRKIGVVTSSTGAAIRDITSILKRRFPAVSILLYPALVQGDGAVKDIIKALKYLDEKEDIDLIIVGRGGGSIEELGAFNNEALARCIFSLKKPVITAVGHETDFTIADFVADVRAATPSAAAEIAVPDRRTMLDELDSIGKAAVSLEAIKISRESGKLQQLKRNLSYVNPERRLSDRHIELDIQFKRLEHSMFRKFSVLKSALSEYEARIGLSNPCLPLERGYGIVMDADGRIVRSAFDVGREQSVSIKMRDGLIFAEVIDVLKEAADE
jgi:exodeoxyribonuclease VII large subunit